MLSENSLVRADAAARKAIESTYIGVCDVIEQSDMLDEKTAITYQSEVVVLEKQPCRLSFEKIQAANQTELGAAVSLGVKLFVAPEIDIKSGSKIVVTQNGVTTVYRASGEAAVYGSHREIMLELWKEWA